MILLFLTLVQIRFDSSGISCWLRAVQFTRVSQARCTPSTGLGRDGTIKAGAMESTLIAVGNMVPQCPHCLWLSDNHLIFHLPLPLALYLSMQYSHKIGAQREGHKRRGLHSPQGCRGGAPAATHLAAFFVCETSLLLSFFPVPQSNGRLCTAVKRESMVLSSPLQLFRAF